MSYLQGFLLLIIIFSGLWLTDEYIGLLSSIIISAISFAVLAFALIADWIERSKVPRSYYIWMLITAITPLVVTLCFALLYSGNFDWLQR